MSTPTQTKATPEQEATLLELLNGLPEKDISTVRSLPTIELQLQFASDYRNKFNELQGLSALVTESKRASLPVYKRIGEKLNKVALELVQKELPVVKDNSDFQVVNHAIGGIVEFLVKRAGMKPEALAIKTALLARNIDDKGNTLVPAYVQEKFNKWYDESSK